MPPRTLASLAHALGAAGSVDDALLALGETLEELDRGASVAFYPYDARRELLRVRLVPGPGYVERIPLDASLEHLPSAVRVQLVSGTGFAELGERSGDFARLLGFHGPLDGALVLRGVRVEGQLAAVVVLVEPRRIFGTRVLDRFAPALALFELAHARYWEREGREEAVHTLEEVTQRVHGEYVRKLSVLESQLEQARRTPAMGSIAVAPPAQSAARDALAAERLAAQQTEAVRRAERRLELVEQQLAAASAQHEQLQGELSRRGETLRQTERTLYLLDRVLSLDAAAHEPRQLVDELLALVGDDMQAQRCSLMLRVPGEQELYLAAARGLSPHIVHGARVRVGEGVAGRVAHSREPLLVQDVREAGQHPLLRDQYFTTGSFISFPLVYHGDLVGVVNLTNRAALGRYAESDVERVRLLGMVIALVATHAGLPEKLAGMTEAA
ncbi:MAG TPA: GAF domain-containing protein [Gemmatirosa sp.]|nr:GAF domain-containing protein [Gemmatirosa sp.]